MTYDKQQATHSGYLAIKLAADKRGAVTPRSGRVCPVSGCRLPDAPVGGVPVVLPAPALLVRAAALVDRFIRLVP